MVQHSLDFDRADPALQGWPVGLYWMHGEDHVSEELELGHVWSGGLGELFRTQGDLAAIGALKELVRALQNCWTQPDRFAGPERRLAWPLRALHDAAAFEDTESGRRFGLQLVQSLADRQNRLGYLEGDLRRHQQLQLQWVNSWVSLGITVDALARSHGWLANGRALEVGQRLADFVLQHADLPGGALAEGLVLDPRSGEVLDRRGRPRKGEAALAAAGVWRSAWWHGGEPELLALAEALWQQALQELQTPREADLVEFAKALQAGRVLWCADPLTANASRPRSVPGGRRGENAARK